MASEKERRKVTLFVVDDAENASQNQAALDELKKIPSVEVEVITYPESMSESYECPFVRDGVRDGGGRTFYGLDGIRFFVRCVISGTDHLIITVSQLLEIAQEEPLKKMAEIYEEFPHTI